MEKIPFQNLRMVLGRQPAAFAVLRGSSAYPALTGLVCFYPVREGVLVAAEVSGLPEMGGDCPADFFGFHIHGGSFCASKGEDPFGGAQAHYDLRGCPHPAHAGDMPPLLGNRGYAVMAFLTDRFSASEVIGKTVIVHGHPDDFSTQPAGDAGEKIACGQIRAWGGK